MRRKPFRFIGLIVIYVTARASLLQLLLRRFPLFFPSRLPFRPVSPMEYTGNTWRWRRNDRSEFLFILHRVTVFSAGSREQEQHKRIPRFRNRPSIRESFLSRETMFVVLNDKRGGEREYSSFVRNVYARRVIEFEMNGTKMKENRNNMKFLKETNKILKTLISRGRRNKIWIECLIF